MNFGAWGKKEVPWDITPIRGMKKNQKAYEPHTAQIQIVLNGQKQQKMVQLDFFFFFWWVKEKNCIEKAAKTVA